ncbi:Mur ligase family protein [Flavobacteriaceae bacterium]|nr:Mur ligase family protein [Flavobacteriaceae bacterium]MDC1492644.1 Mur ligase family protein [Flavobacteriaceae bacterium]
MRIHFIAIGGAAMHNLAIALKIKKYHITGSDDIINDPSKSRLESYQLYPKELGWFVDRITNEIDAIVLGMHAREDNPELLKAKELSIKIFSYPEFIYEQSKLKTRVVIGGSHGKTTITSMILHVMNFYDKEVDYMVGAQLEGFDVMVKLTEKNDFIVLEGDEYLSSPIDKRPKFHLYKPNIALISGISWDHINVFPTYEIYKKQFDIFLDSIVEGGSITYNSDDTDTNQAVNNTNRSIRKFDYSVPDYSIRNGITYLETNEGELPLEIFGKHNLSNLMGAKWICQQMGVDEDDFFLAISSFKGASNRLEKVFSVNNSFIYKDFAHSPSKVNATVNAVKNQFEDHKIIACFELHTFSSLNSDFINEYKNTLNNADMAIVYFSKTTLESKKIKNIDLKDIVKAFNNTNLLVFNDSLKLKDYLYTIDYKKSVLLMMSSGNFGNINFNDLQKLLLR